MHLMPMSSFTLLAILAGASGAAASENSEAVYVATHGSWTTNKVVDTFDDSELARFAYHRAGEDGSVRYVCRNGQLAFTAYADNMFVKTLGNSFDSKPIQVLLKVADGPILETEGEYPNLIVGDQDTVVNVRDMFRSASQARIRTIHGAEKHTFILKLNGFTRASEWVDSACELAIP